MKFSLVSVLAFASSFGGVFSAPAKSAACEDVGLGGILSVGLDAPALSITAGLSIVADLQTKLEVHASSINATITAIVSTSSSSARKKATKDVCNDMLAMTLAINAAVAEIGLQANGLSLTAAAGVSIEARDASDASVEALAGALRNVLLTASLPVNTALATLGVKPLLSFLNPLAGSLSGLTLTLPGVVNTLLPTLNVVLDGILKGTGGLLAALIL